MPEILGVVASCGFDNRLEVVDERLMTDLSVEVHAQYRDAAKTFNYFVTGGSATLFTFLLERWVPAQIGPNVATIELLAILQLAFSIAFGFRMLENEVLVLKGHYGSLLAKNKSNICAEALRAGGPVFTERGPVSASQMEQSRETWSKIAKETSETSDRKNNAAAFAYRWRNWLLFTGALTYIISRISGAYI